MGVSLNVAENPAFPYIALAGVVLLLLLGLYFLIPMFYSGGKDAAKQAFSDLSTGLGGAVDSTLKNISSIAGFNPDQNPADRTRTDEVKGLVAANQGDRALSDLVDSPWQYLKNLVTGTAK